jgi:hypothetical protein
MNRNLGLRLMLLIAVLAAASLGCELSGDTKTSKGERALFYEHGFSFTPPAGTVVSNLGFLGAEVLATKVDKSGDMVLGPKCFGATSTSRKRLEDDPQSYWAAAVASEKNNVGLDLGVFQETQVSDHFAVEGEDTGTYLASVDSKSTPIYGKRLDVQLDEKQVFTLTCDGPVSRKAETLSMYDSLKGSLQFFDPITSTPED